MKPKSLKIMYWVVTGIFAAFNLFSGVTSLMPPNQQSIDVMTLLGYPLYLLTILGVAKILGSIALLQTKYHAIKEWAYAGFAIDIIGASASFYFAGGDAFSVGFPFVFLAVMFWSYYLWKRIHVVDHKHYH